MKMKKNIPLVLLLVTTSTLAATEITKEKSNGMKSLGKITIIENTITNCLKNVSMKADAKGAPYYVVIRAGDMGKGANRQVTAELFQSNDK